MTENNETRKAQIDKVLRDISVSDLSTYYIVAGACTILIVCQSVVFAIRAWKREQRYDVRMYTRQLTFISSLYALLAMGTNIANALVLLEETYAQTKSIYAFQLAANAAWLQYSVSLFGGCYKRRIACFVWLSPILFIILLLTNVIGYLGISIVSLVQIILSLVIIIIKLLCFDSIKINSRLVKFGIILVYSFKPGLKFLFTSSKLIIQSYLNHRRLWTKSWVLEAKT